MAQTSLFMTNKVKEKSMRDKYGMNWSHQVERSSSVVTTILRGGDLRGGGIWGQMGARICGDG